MAAARVDIPAIELVSDYKIKGRALIVPIEGNGLLRANLCEYSSLMVVSLLLAPYVFNIIGVTPESSQYTPRLQS